MFEESLFVRITIFVSLNLFSVRILQMPEKAIRESFSSEKFSGCWEEKTAAAENFHKLFSTNFSAAANFTSTKFCKSFRKFANKFSPLNLFSPGKFFTRRPQSFRGGFTQPPQKLFSNFHSSVKIISNFFTSSPQLKLSLGKTKLLCGEFILHL